MDEHKRELLNEAVELERNMAALYLLYSSLFAEDKAFWTRLYEEEVRHAALVGTAIDFFERFPEEIAGGNLDEIKMVNADIRCRVEEFEDNKPAKEKAYQYAFSLENMAYEMHYQQLAANTSDTSEEMERFQSLNQDDKDHAERIRGLMSG